LLAPVPALIPKVTDFRCIWFAPSSATTLLSTKVVIDWPTSNEFAVRRSLPDSRLSAGRQ